MANDSFELNEINQLIATIQPLAKTSLTQNDPVLDWLAASQRTESPHFDHPRLSLFSAAHGFAQEIGLAPSENYENFIKGCLNGTGRLNRLALAANTDLRLYEMDGEEGESADFTESDLVRSMAYGMMAVEPGLDLMAITAFGHGSREAAEALIALHLNTNPSDLTVKRLVKQADGAKGLTALLRIGGYELAAMCGAIIAARLANCPVLLEGAQGYAAFLLLSHENPVLADHCRLCGMDAPASHRLDLTAPAIASADPGLTIACVIPLLRTDVILNENASGVIYKDERESA